MERVCKRGFTLIELLVVVAIIALLIAILLPTLAKVRMQVLRTRCGASIRGWGTAVITYQAENNYRFAAKLTYYGGGIDGTQWDQDMRAVSGITWTGNLGMNPIPGTDTLIGQNGTIIIGIYTTQSSGHSMNSKLRFCPADTGQYTGGSGVFYYGNRPLPSYKFAYYSNATGAANANQPTPIWNAGAFTNPAGKLLMCDSNAQGNYGDCVSWIDDPNAGGVIRNLNGGAGTAIRASYSSKDEIQLRHGGKGNVLFLDGHVDCVPWSEYARNIPAGPTDADASKKWTRLSF